MKIKLTIFFLALFKLIFAQPEIPDLKMWATDLTGTLTSQELLVLNNRLREFEDTTSNQLVTLMIPTLNGYPIEYYAYDVATQNKIGTEKFDNGILFLIVKNDRKMRIEVGYGLEGVLPDALASSIIRNDVAPFFREEKYFAGISAGIDAIIAAVAGEYSAQNEDTDDTSGSIFSTIIMILITLFILFARGGGRRRGGLFYMGGGFSGGSGGFSSGGFSGGGGSFGGGGASGSW
ncbi:MAG: hypothetical protein Kow0098_12210 [Ignavibacteriaceae bacterium]